MSGQRDEDGKGYTPLLGIAALTPFYDAVIAIFTREGRWRSLLIAELSPKPEDVIVDIGSGTGRLAEQIWRVQPFTTYLGVDPDEQAVAMARRRARRMSESFTFRTGFFTGSELIAGRSPNRIVTSLVLHQTPLAEKRRILHAAYEGLQPDGVLLIADYGLQKTRFMQLLFRLTVQALDGVQDTQPNADGVLPTLLNEAGFAAVDELARVDTLTGTITILKASKTPTSAARGLHPAPGSVQSSAAAHRRKCR